MPKRKREMSTSKNEKWIKEGRGQGVGKDYKPWFTIQDVITNGRATRLRGIKTQRQHEFLTDLERSLFYIFEFSDRVIDIREHFPLRPIEQTMLIAEELGIEYPVDPKTGESVVFVSTFLITEKSADGNILKYAYKLIDYKDLTSFRNIELLEIERRYWEKKEIKWAIVTDKNIDKQYSKNISIVYPFYNLSQLSDFAYFNESQINKLVTNFKTSIVGTYIVRERTAEYEEEMSLAPGVAIAIFKHLIITKQIGIDMKSRMEFDMPIDVHLIK